MTRIRVNNQSNHRTIQGFDKHLNDNNDIYVSIEFHWLFILYKDEVSSLDMRQRKCRTNERRERNDHI